MGVVKLGKNVTGKRKTRLLWRGGRCGKQFVWWWRGNVSRTPFTKDGLYGEGSARNRDFGYFARVPVLFFTLFFSRFVRFFRTHSHRDRRELRRGFGGGVIRQIARKNGQSNFCVFAGSGGDFFVFFKVNYVLLFVFDFGFFRRYSRGYGNGRRNGYDTLARTRRRRGAKNCAMRQPFFLFADECGGIEKARGKRTFENAGNCVGDRTRTRLFGAGRDACGIPAVHVS